MKDLHIGLKSTISVLVSVTREFSLLYFFRFYLSQSIFIIIYLATDFMGLKTKLFYGFTDLMIMEMRSSMEADKQRSLLDQKHKFEIEKEQAIMETKRKQWCAFCQKEAQLYCCWNTAYCSYNCQVVVWESEIK